MPSWNVLDPFRSSILTPFPSSFQPQLQILRLRAKEPSVHSQNPHMPTLLLHPLYAVSIHPKRGSLRFHLPLPDCDNSTILAEMLRLRGVASLLIRQEGSANITIHRSGVVPVCKKKGKDRRLCVPPPSKVCEGDAVLMDCFRCRYGRC